MFSPSSSKLLPLGARKDALPICGGCLWRDVSSGTLCLRLFARFIAIYWSMARRIAQMGLKSTMADG